MFLFQNCAQAPNVGAPEVSGSLEVAPAPNTTKQSLRSYQEVWWPELRSQSGGWLRLDTHTGKIEQVSWEGQVSRLAGYLSSSQLNEFRKLEQSLEVCVPQEATPAPGQMCTMIYKYPYARLTQKASIVNLGEMRNGCDIPIDFCDIKAGQTLINWLSSLALQN